MIRVTIKFLDAADDVLEWDTLPEAARYALAMLTTCDKATEARITRLDETVARYAKGGSDA